MKPLYQNDTYKVILTEDFPFVLEQIWSYTWNKCRQLGESKDFLYH